MIINQSKTQKMSIFFDILNMPVSPGIRGLVRYLQRERERETLSLTLLTIFSLNLRATTCFFIMLRLFYVCTGTSPGVQPVMIHHLNIDAYGKINK